MRTIRTKVFETNSSSTHSLVILSKEDYEKWENGEVVLDLYKKEVKPADPNKKIIHNEDGSLQFNGERYDDMYELALDSYDIIDDEYAPKEYIDELADVEQEELDGKVIMSIYRGEIG